MAKEVTKFLANDGTAFDSEAEADAHDALMAEESQIAAYVKATGLDGARADAVRKHLRQFLASVNRGVTPPVEEKKERKKKVAETPKA